MRIPYQTKGPSRTVGMGGKSDSRNNNNSSRSWSRSSNWKTKKTTTTTKKEKQWHDPHQPHCKSHKHCWFEMELTAHFDAIANEIKDSQGEETVHTEWWIFVHKHEESERERVSHGESKNHLNIYYIGFTLTLPVCPLALARAQHEPFGYSFSYYVRCKRESERRKI